MRWFKEWDEVEQNLRLHGLKLKVRGHDFALPWRYRGVRLGDD